MHTRHWFGAAIVLAVVATAPLIASFGAQGVAALAGCALNESEVLPCRVLGADVGGALADAFALGWLMAATIWLLPVAIAVWSYGAVRHRRARTRPDAPGRPVGR